MLRRLRSLAALLTLVAIAIGVPLLLVRLAGWPLPTAPPDWQRIRVALQQGDIPAAAVIKTIAVLVWLAWAQLMWALVWELVVNVPSIRRGRPPRPTPLATAGVSSGIARLVALAFTITIATTSTTVSAIAAAPRAVATVEVVTPSAVPVSPPARTSTTTDSDPLQASRPLWCVAPADSLWSIAESALGDGSRVSEILELNATLGSPRNLQPGQILSLPPDAIVPSSRVPAPVAYDGPGRTTIVVEAPATYLPEQVVVIQPGDNLWNLADARLETANGHAAPPAQVLTYVNDVIDANPEIVEDPNLIYPGEQFRFPALGSPPVAEPPVDETTDWSSPPEAPASDPVARIVPEPQPSIHVPPTTAVDALDADTTHATRPAAAPEAHHAPSAAVPVSTNAPQQPAAPTTTITDDQANESQAPILAGITGATVLASGLLLLYRRLRRRQSATGAQHAPRLPSDEPLQRVEHQLVAAADVPLVRWAAHQLHTLLTDPAVATDLIGFPLVVEISDANGIEILWSQPNPAAPSSWTATGNGWTWHRPYDPDQPIPAEPVAVPLPGLVTIGTRDSRQVLVDLEALGSLAIGGDPDRSEALIRSILLEAATGDELANAYVHTVDLPVPAAAHLHRFVERNAASAIEHLTAIVDGYQQVLAETELETTLALRTLEGPEGRELTIIATRAELVGLTLDRLLALAEPHIGGAVVLLGEHNDARATITIDVDGSAQVQPIGLRFSAAGLPPSTKTAIEALLDDAAAVPYSEESDAEAPTGVPPDVDDDSELMTESDGNLDESDDDWRIPTPGLLVRVLGAPRIEGVTTLPAIDVSLVAFLACHRRHATEDQVINAVWCGKAIEKVTLWNHITKIRSVLGVHVPPRSQGDGVRVGDDVTTDLDVLETILEQARHASSGRAIELLASALDLIEGPPFDAPGYDWAYEHQYHAQASAAVEAAALRLVGLAIDAGQAGIARRALAQGLRALPVNEPLYRARMRLEANEGNQAGVRQAFNELTQQLDELGGGDENFDPSPQTRSLLTQLLVHGA